MKDKPNSAERVKIFSLFKENFSIFLLIEQIMRKYGGFFCYLKKEEIKKYLIKSITQRNQRNSYIKVFICVNIF